MSTHLSRGVRFYPAESSTISQALAVLLNKVMDRSLGLETMVNIPIRYDLLRELGEKIGVGYYKGRFLLETEHGLFNINTRFPPLANVLILETDESSPRVLRREEPPAYSILEFLKLLSLLSSSIYTYFPPALLRDLPSLSKISKLRYVAFLPSSSSSTVLEENPIRRTYLVTYPYSHYIIFYPVQDMGLIEQGLNYLLHSLLLPSDIRRGNPELTIDLYPNLIEQADVIVYPLTAVENLPRLGLKNMARQIRNIVMDAVARVYNVPYSKLLNDYLMTNSFPLLIEEDEVTPSLLDEEAYRLTREIAEELCKRFDMNYLETIRKVPRKAVKNYENAAYSLILPLLSKKKWNILLNLNTVAVPDDENENIVKLYLTPCLVTSRRGVEPRTLKELLEYLFNFFV